MDIDIEWLAYAQGQACLAAESFAKDWYKFTNDDDNVIWRELAIQQASIAESLGRIYDCLAKSEI